MPYEKEKKRNRVVAHFKDGRLLKGHTHDFTPVKDMFHLVSELDADSGHTYEVKTADLKALFFVKILDGRKEYAEKKSFEDVDSSNLRGLSIMVEFYDGEILRGKSLGYNKKKKGFFIVPVDPVSNNERIFVVAEAVREVKLGSAAEE